MENNIVGLPSISNKIKNELLLHIKHLLFYGGNLMLINVNKAKSMVFSKGATMKKIYYYKEVIENVKEFKNTFTFTLIG